MMDKSESIKELAGALCKAQSQIRAAEMNATNPFLKNKYADLGSVIEAIRPAMTANGLSVSQLVGGDGSAISLNTIIMHESGEYISEVITFPLGEEKGRSLAQSAGAIVTYLRRYALSAMLGVYADEDTDGASNGNKPIQPAQQPQEEREPLEPKALAEAMFKKSARYVGKQASDKQRGLVAGMLSAIFESDLDRHAVQEFLFGTSSLTDTTDEQILVALDWLKPEKDSGGQFVPSPIAEKEAQAVLKHLLVEQGQGKFEL